MHPETGILNQCQLLLESSTPQICKPLNEFCGVWKALDDDDCLSFISQCVDSCMH